MTSESQVVEFTLGQERYCLSIEHVDEIIDMDDTDLTALPDSPPHVEGLLDLRGNTATIINPKRRFDVGDTSVGTRVIVFEASEEDDYVGWAVDDVEQVSRIQLNFEAEPPSSTSAGLPMTVGSPSREGRSRHSTSNHVR